MVGDEQDIVDEARRGLGKSIENLSCILCDSDLFVEEVIE